MKQAHWRKGQRGIALVSLLILLIMAGAYGFYRVANNRLNQSTRDQTTLSRLNAAKEALIAYAATDDKRPGRLPCPDFNGSGNADGTYTRNNCDSYSGWLPGKTLRLIDYADTQGLQFRYLLSPNFAHDDDTKSINSDTPTSFMPVKSDTAATFTPINSSTTTSFYLDVDNPDPAKNPDQRIVALIIATRGDIDSTNADGDPYFYNGKGDNSLENDLIVAVTRAELMAITETRIANQARVCLESHALDAKNSPHTYPWPAPLSNNIFKGEEGSLFGQFPATQPGDPKQSLNATRSRLSDQKNQFDLALTADNLTEQRTVLLEIQETAAYARAQLDRLFIVASALKKAADFASTDTYCGSPIVDPNMNTLNQAFKDGTTSAATFAAASSSLSSATRSSLPTLPPLVEALINSGFNIAASELRIQNETLLSKLETATLRPDSTTLNALLSQINKLRNNYLEYAKVTTHLALNQKLTDARNAALLARDSTLAAKNTPTDQDKLNLAFSQAADFIAANESLLNESLLTASPSALSSTAYQLIISAEFLARQTIQLQEPVADSDYDDLKSRVQALLDFLNSLSTTGTLLTLQNTAIANTSLALRELSQPIRNRSTVEQTVLASRRAILSFGNTIVPDIARESLLSYETLLMESLTTPPTNVTAARTLRDPAILGSIYWAGIASSWADDIARLSRKSVCSSGDSITSGYASASKLLDSLDGSTGLIEAIDNNSPDRGIKSVASSLLLQSLIDKLNSLEQTLDTTLAAGAVPTLWYSETCNFIKPATGSSKPWWAKDNWQSVFFYQLSTIDRRSTGNLTVNGQGNYRAVVLSGGTALVGQTRTTRTTQSFLEGKNQDNSRNNLAKTPASNFQDAARSTEFNDRLAY